MPIYFLTEEVSIKLKDTSKLKKWVKNTVSLYGQALGNISFVICSDGFLSQLNSTYLHHHTFTDIITFDYSDGRPIIEGEIYISWDRVIENAQKFGCETLNELYRVMIHGILHLIGYLDKTSTQKLLMRCVENFHLEQLRSTWNK